MAQSYLKESFPAAMLVPGFPKIDGTHVRVCLVRMKRPICQRLATLMSLLAIAVAGCSKSNSPEATAATPQPSASSNQPGPSSPAVQEETGAGSYACTLLTKEETEAVQGEPFKSTKASEKSGAGLIISQCYFELPTTVNSIVVTVTQKAAGPDARDPRQSWQEIFHREKTSEKKEGDGEEKEPQKIEGIGDEAFWMGSRVGGSLYVLKGDSYIRISVGGAGDQAQKTEKSKALAQSVLKRL